MECVSIRLEEQQSRAFFSMCDAVPSTVSVNQWLKENFSKIQQEAREILSLDQIKSLNLLKKSDFRGVLHLQNLPQPDSLPSTPQSGSRGDDIEYLPEYVIAAISAAAGFAIKDQRAFDITPNNQFGFYDDPTRPVEANLFHFDAQYAPFVFLSCKRGNLQAHTDFLDVKEMLKEFSEQEIEILKDKDLFSDITRTRSSTGSSILTEIKTGLTILREYTDLDNFSGKSEDSQFVLDKLKQKIFEYSLSINLKPGDVVIFNNSYDNGIMHGQTQPYTRHPDMAQTRWITRHYAYSGIPESWQQVAGSVMEVTPSLWQKVALVFNMGSKQR